MYQGISFLLLFVSYSNLVTVAMANRRAQSVSGPSGKGVALITQTHKAHTTRGSWDTDSETVPIKVIPGAHDFKFFTGKRRNLKAFKVFLKYVYFMT